MYLIIEKLIRIESPLVRLLYPPKESLVRPYRRVNFVIAPHPLTIKGCPKEQKLTKSCFRK